MSIFTIALVFLALAFLAAGLMKVTQPRDKLAAQMAWVEDFSDSQVKGIGALEVLGAVGLLLPWLTGIALSLVPLAAIGLALTMVGAAYVHFKRGEMNMIPINVVLLAVSLFVAFG